MRRVLLALKDGSNLGGESENWNPGTKRRYILLKATAKINGWDFNLVICTRWWRDVPAKQWLARHEEKPPRAILEPSWFVRKRIQSWLCLEERTWLEELVPEASFSAPPGGGPSSLNPD